MIGFKMKNYLNYWKLQESIFTKNITGDHIYLSTGMRRNYYTFYNSIPIKLQLLLIDGSFAVGKSTFAKSFYWKLNEDRLNTIMINPHTKTLKPGWFFSQINQKIIGSEYKKGSYLYQIQGLGLSHQYLKDNKKHIIIFCDKANYLLEGRCKDELELFFNFQASNGFYFTLILIDTNIYENIIKQNNLSHFVTKRLNIPVLSTNEMKDYILWYISKSTITYNPFSHDALEIIANHSKGNLYKTNNLCEILLVIAAKENLESINADFVKNIISQNQLV